MPDASVLPPLIRMHADLGQDARQDFVVKIFSPSTLVVSIVGDGAVFEIEDFVASKMVPSDEPPRHDSAYDYEDHHPGGDVHPGGAHAVQWVETGRAKAGEPLPVLPNQHVQGHVIARGGVTPGMRTASLHIEGLGDEPVEIPIRFMVGKVSITAAENPVVLHQEQWGEIGLVVSLPGSLDTEITLSVSSPADAIKSRFVVPTAGSVTTSLKVLVTKHFFEIGPAQVQIIVEGVQESPQYHTLDIIVQAPLVPASEADRPSSGYLLQYVREMNRPVAVRYLGFRCVRESAEFSLADEPYYIFGILPTDLEMKNKKRTHIYDDVDEGEIRLETIEIYSGPPIGLAFSVTALEHDTGDPDEYEKIVEKAVDKAAEGAVDGLAQVPVVGPALAVLGSLVYIVLGPALIEWVNDLLGTGEDIVASTVVTLTPQEMMRIRRSEPADFNGIRAHFSRAFHRPGEGAFTLYFDIVPAV
ncbi:hypothetical protein [Mesorhizobium sp. A623]